MPSLSTILLRRLLPARLSLLTLSIASCAPLPPTAAVTIPPVPAGAARVWFYRDGGPYVDGTGTPYLRMNGTIVGLSQPEGALYRDVAPGQYHVTVDSYGKDFNQSRDVYLYPGQQVYFKIVSLRDWIQGGGGRNSSGYERNTFYVWEIPPEAAQADVARSQFYGGG